MPLPSELPCDEHNYLGKFRRFQPSPSGCSGAISALNQARNTVAAAFDERLIEDKWELLKRFIHRH